MCRPQPKLRRPLVTACGPRLIPKGGGWSAARRTHRFAPCGAGALARAPRLAALHCGSFSTRATLSGHSRRRQPAPGGRSLVTSRWSPGPPECGMPSARGDRAADAFASAPEVSGANLHPVPPAHPTQAMPRESAPRWAGWASIHINRNKSQVA